jgi:Domain of Unknown Function (DUF326)
MSEQLPEEPVWIGIQRALECHCVCSETISHCLERGGSFATKPLPLSLMDCAQICQLTADLLLRGSPLRHLMTSICATACERSAQHCDRFDDDILRQCAEACRRCAEACRDIESVDAGTGTAPPAAEAPEVPAVSDQAEPRDARVVPLVATSETPVLSVDTMYR